MGVRIKLQTSVINSYRGWNNIYESPAFLKGNSNIGSRSGVNKGESNDATERSELSKHELARS